MALSRDAILAADDLPRKEVKVPEWGGTLWVRSLTALELERFGTANENEHGITICSRLVALTACDVNGKQLFSDADAKEIGSKNYQSLKRVFRAAAELNGIDVSNGEEETKAAVKNSATTTGDFSS